MIIWENGDFYSGGWKNGKRHGEGFYLWQNGKCYQGDWDNGKMSGKGVEYRNIREKFKYDGEFKNNKWNGTGILYDKNGRKEYEGEFKDKLLHGNGILFLANGNIYIGGFENGNRKGYGTLISKDRKKVLEVGFWEDDKFKFLTNLIL